jgi:hypothetical protein
MDEASKLLEAAHVKETQALRRDRDAAAAAMASHQARAHELERKLLEAQLSKQVGGGIGTGSLAKAQLWARIGARIK